MTHRRKFLQDSALLLAGGTLLSSFDNRAFAIFKNRIAPSDQLNVGAIGIGRLLCFNIELFFPETFSNKIPPVIIDHDDSVFTKRTFILQGCCAPGAQVE